MQFNHDELMLMMLYNTGTQQGLVRELRLMQCYLRCRMKLLCGSCQSRSLKS